ncbi:hypothetical protein [Paenibacillus piscarius]|uniref:hypothetical protein n=1 Tax=Paenibacillus piscarius TaxID=1089681 RepID=UPI001EE9571B|nr:hypothetical protein [Paenibacillus piscarius]
MDTAQVQSKVEISNDEDFISFQFTGIHSEITALIPKSEERKAYEKRMAIFKKIEDAKSPPINTDLAYVIELCDVNYEGIRLAEGEKQKLLYLLKEMFKDQLPIQ